MIRVRVPDVDDIVDVIDSDQDLVATWLDFHRGENSIGEHKVYVLAKITKIEATAKFLKITLRTPHHTPTSGDALIYFPFKRDVAYTIYENQFAIFELFYEAGNDDIHNGGPYIRLEQWWEINRSNRLTNPNS